MRILFTYIFCSVLILIFSNAYAQDVLLHIEDFETDGEGTRYTRSHQFDSVGSFFKTGSVSDFQGLGHIPTNIQKNKFLAIQNPNRGNDAGVALGAPIGGICTLQLKDIAISNYSDLYVNYYLSAKNSQIYGPRRFTSAGLFIDVEYQIDNGAWTTLAKVSNSNISATTYIYYTNIPKNVANSSLDTKLVEAFAQVRDTIANPGPGDTLRLRYLFKGNNALKMLALDKIRVYGDLLSPLPSNRVRLLHEYCGYTTNTLNDNIWCVDEGADSYDFEFSGGDLGAPVTVNETNPRVGLSNVTGLNYGQTYNVRVRGIFGGTPGPYSDTWWNSCQIKITNDPPFIYGCGNSITFLTNITSQNMGNATNYRFRINGSTEYTTGGSRSFRLDEAGFSSNGSYDIEAAAFIDGAFTSYGEACTFSVSGGAPIIVLSKYQCGRTFNNLESYLQTTSVPGATNYEWSITGGLTTTVSSGTSNKLRLADIPGISYSVGSLNIRVRCTVGASTGNYGSMCGITIANSIPSTSFNSWVCNQSVDSSRYVCTNPVGLADGYSFKLIDPSGDSSFVTKSNGCVQMQEFSNFSALGAYNISVRVLYLGDSSSTSPSCPLTYSSGMKVGRTFISSANSSEVFGNIEVYPNPTNGVFYVSLKNHDLAETNSSFSLYNTLGTEVIKGTFNGNSISLDLSAFNNGVYIFKLSSEGLSKNVRVIKQ